MSNETQGIYRKFKVTRSDGSSEHGGKHEHCSYYVLDLEHDPFAIPALKAYAAACKETHPNLAADIERIVAADSADDMAGHLMFHAEEG